MSLKLKNHIYPLFVIALSYLIGVLLYKSLPDLMTTHWGVAGQPNGYSSKLVGVFLMPLIMLIMLPLLAILPHADPYKHNFKQFQGYFYQFINVIFTFLFYLYLLTLLYNTGLRFNMIQLLTPAFSLLFYFIGILLANTHRNWFVGIRTPWTLSNDVVWQKTHQLGAVLFRISAIVSLVGLLLPQLAFFFIIGPILLISIFLFGYSYYLYRQIGEKGYNKKL